VQPRQGFARVWANRETQESFHAPGGVGECEGMNFHTPRRTPILGVGIPIDS